jgi:hypothetical protein
MLTRVMIHPSPTVHGLTVLVSHAPKELNAQAVQGYGLCPAGGTLASLQATLGNVSS